MRNLKISAFADEYADSFEEQLTALNEFEIENIEIRFLNGKNISVLKRNEATEAKKKLDAFGINVSAIGSPIGKIQLDGDINDHLETAKRIFESANIFDTRYIRVFSFYAPNGKDIADMKSEVLYYLEKFVVLAREYGITLCHENEAKIYGDTPNRCKELLDHFSGELKCVFDMGNFVLEGAEPYTAYELLKEDIAYFHIKDALSQGAIVPAGKGEAKIKEILSAHREYAKEDFFVSLEPHLQTFSGLNALVGRTFDNPYKYTDQKAAFTDAVIKFKELI
jgi:sugar phosphate isomerase/epimerase